MPRDAQARGGIGVPACARSPSVAHLEEKGIDMAVDNKKIAEDVLAAVGGASNITSATHCMTRLRLNLKDQSIPKDDEIKKIKGVLGAQCSGGQYQVIIGQNVPKVYDAAIALGVKGEGALDESLDAGAKEPLTFKSAGRAVLNYVSKSVVSLIPIMLAAAMFRTIAAICGPTMLNIWSTDSEIYNLFNNWLYNAGFYFMPIFLGWSAAKQLGASPQLGMMLGGVLIAPELLDLVNAAAESGATTTSVYGIPAMLNNYSSTVLPILLCVPVMWQVEKLFKKFVPDALATVFNPFLTMLVMVPVSLCVLAPIGSVLGDGLGNFMFSLGNAGGIATVVAIAIIGGFWEFFVMTGMHGVLITLGMAMLLGYGHGRLPPNSRERGEKPDARLPYLRVRRRCDRARSLRLRFQVSEDVCRPDRRRYRGRTCDGAGRMQGLRYRQCEHYRRRCRLRRRRYGELRVGLCVPCGGLCRVGRGDLSLRLHQGAT